MANNHRSVRCSEYNKLWHIMQMCWIYQKVYDLKLYLLCYIETIALSFQTRKNGPKVLLLGTYRPPNLSKSVWESGRFSNIILVGDLNCDLLNPDSGAKDGRAHIDLAEVYLFSNLIKKPARITEKSTSLIDVIFTSKPRSFLSSGVYDTEISDHSLVYAVMRSHCPRACMKTKNKRSFKP